MTIAERLQQLAEEHAMDDWDGYGAKAVTKDAVESTMQFLTFIPADLLDKVDLGVEPDGHITAEWYKRTGAIGGATFSASIHPEKPIISCAWVLKHLKGHEVFVWNDPMILSLIRKVYE